MLSFTCYKSSMNRVYQQQISKCAALYKAALKAEKLAGSALAPDFWD